MLVLPIIALRADENDTEILESKLNDFYSIKSRQISESEYTAQKTATEHLRHKPYKKITDIAEARKMLGKRIKEVWNQEANYISPEITYKGGVKKVFDVWFGWSNEFSNLNAYYPEAGVLILWHEAEGEAPIDLNDSANKHVGNPKYYAISPDKQFRINGYDPGGAADGMNYWLEKWNKSKKKYEFIEYLHLFKYISECFWISNNKVLFKYLGDNVYYARYYEMEIITK
jgi:hypothetical protein